MGVRLDKPWRDLTAANVAAWPASSASTSWPTPRARAAHRLRRRAHAVRPAERARGGAGGRRGGQVPHRGHRQLPEPLRGAADGPQGRPRRAAARQRRRRPPPARPAEPRDEEAPWTSSRPTSRRRSSTRCGGSCARRSGRWRRSSIPTPRGVEPEDHARLTAHHQGHGPLRPRHPAGVRRAGRRHRHPDPDRHRDRAAPRRALFALLRRVRRRGPGPALRGQRGPEGALPLPDAARREARLLRPDRAVRRLRSRPAPSAPRRCATATTG